MERVVVMVLFVLGRTEKDWAGSKSAAAIRIKVVRMVLCFVCFQIGFEYKMKQQQQQRLQLSGVPLR